MLIPLFFAIVAFVVAMAICGTLVPDSTLTISLFAAAAAFIASSRRIARINFDRDKPQMCIYRMPAPQAYSLIKEILRTFRWGKRKWFIQNANDNTLSIRAISEWDDYSFKEYKFLAPEGSLSRQVILEISSTVGSKPELANVELSWNIHSPLIRSECNGLQDFTKEAIKQVLEDSQSKL